MPNEDIEIVVHRESVVHSAIVYQDNSMIAQLGVPDMRIPIQYALTYPERKPESGCLTFPFGLRQSYLLSPIMKILNVLMSAEMQSRNGRSSSCRCKWCKMKKV